MTISSPVVSVGVPTYNNPEGLKRTLDSITSQTYQNLEIIISENASPTREVERIARDFKKKDARIRYYRQEENKGVWFNFQFVLDQAKGKYFMWAADDDYWLPEFISKMVAELDRNQESSVAFCATRRLLDNKKIYDEIRFSGKLNPSKMNPYQLSMAIAAGKKYNLFIYGLFFTEFLKQAIENLPIVVSSDRLFILQCALATEFSYIDEILHIRNVHSKPVRERYKDEYLGKAYTNFFYHEKTLATLVTYLLKSKIIPSNRKLYIPFLFFRYALNDKTFFRRLLRFIFLPLLNLRDRYLNKKVP